MEFYLLLALLISNVLLWVALIRMAQMIFKLINTGRNINDIDKQGKDDFHDQ